MKQNNKIMDIASLNKLIKKRTVTNFKEINDGDKIIFVSNSNGHNYTLNKVYTYRQPLGITSRSTSATNIVKESTNRNTAQISDIVVVDALLNSESLSEHLENLKKEISIIEEVKEVLDNNKVKEIDAKSFLILRELTTSGVVMNEDQINKLKHIMSKAEESFI